MSILGIDGITYGVEDLAQCRRFFLDWGLELVRESPQRLEFETLNGCQVLVLNEDDPSLPPAIEPGSTLREVVWGADSETNLACTDPNGLAIRVRVSQKRKIDIKVTGAPVTTVAYCPSTFEIPPNNSTLTVYVSDGINSQQKAADITIFYTSPQDTVTFTCCDHGTWVMGCIAGNKPGTYVGTAPGATFALARTEVDASESTIEMVYWGMAAEWLAINNNRTVGIDVTEHSDIGSRKRV